MQTSLNVTANMQHVPRIRQPLCCRQSALRSVQHLSCGRALLSTRPVQHLGIQRRGGLQVRASGTVSSNDFKPGMTLEFDNAPWKVVESLHVKPGKGAAFVRTKLKNYLTNNTVEKTFRAGESVGAATIEKADTQFTYVDGEDYVFMDLNNYEERRVKRDESWAKFLQEGAEVSLVLWNNKVITVDIPNTVELLVIKADPGLKGNSATGSSKPCTVETGATVMVPLFIESGEKIKIDTRTDSYMGRAGASSN